MRRDDAKGLLARLGVGFALGLVSCEVDVSLGGWVGDAGSPAACQGQPCGAPCGCESCREHCDGQGQCLPEKDVPCFLPCRGRGCGAPCAPCDPLVCTPPPEHHYCHPKGECTLQVPACEPWTPCGQIECPHEQYCCNASCSVCVPYGHHCAPVSCGPGETVCGLGTCPPGTFCCDPFCGTCIGWGENCPITCTRQGEVCGRNFCGGSETCCNPGCGICMGGPMECSEPLREPCPATPPLDCGRTWCPDAAGPVEVCCNEICSICAPKNEACASHASCD